MFAQELFIHTCLCLNVLDLILCVNMPCTALWSTKVVFKCAIKINLNLNLINHFLIHVFLHPIYMQTQTQNLLQLLATDLLDDLTAVIPSHLWGLIRLYD